MELVCIVGDVQRPGIGLNLDHLDAAVGHKPHAVDDVGALASLKRELQAKWLGPIIEHLGIDLTVHEERAFVHALVRLRAARFTAGVDACRDDSPSRDDGADGGAAWRGDQGR
ncbi:hypothetical protein D3C85_1672570 [compost metagenome]